PACSSAAGVPQRIVGPAGAASVSFSIATQNPATQTDATITASSGVAGQSAILTIVPSSAALPRITLTPTSPTTGASVNGTVTLGAPAPAGGAVVLLSTSNSL